MSLKYGKLFKLKEAQILWKTDKRGSDAASGNTVMSYLNAGTLVLVTKHGRFRYVQVVIGELVGYIWCATNRITEQHFEEIHESEELL